MQLMDGAVATANANPSLVLADMDALTRQCDAQLAEHDAQLARLAAGIATLEDERAAVLSKRQEVVDTREQALRVQGTLLAAARAGAALRGGQRDGRTPPRDSASPGERENTASGSPSAETPAAPTAAAEEDGLFAEPEVPAVFDASKLGPRGMQALRIINGAPGQQWTPQLLAVQLEGAQAEADGKAHNRARTLMDDLAKKQLVVKKYSSGKPRRCHFVAISAAEDA
ncbi:hypothetical protein [Streptomyces nitrosporeus]|uniref:hypothetical protein n=1 Tax=Streptomyces nitrosporeus TaxID=28894 RepID=UPI00332B5D6F